MLDPRLSNIAQRDVNARINMRVRGMPTQGCCQRCACTTIVPSWTARFGSRPLMTQRLPGIRALPQLLARYREPDSARGAFELLITAVPFLIIWTSILSALDHGYWLGLLLEVPAAGLLVRLFMIQHDCGHGSFFCSRVVNDWVGRALGVVTLTPYDYWRHNHARHHANSGNLDHRGLGDIDTLT